jgi:hypothetical protein
MGGLLNYGHVAGTSAQGEPTRNKAVSNGITGRLRKRQLTCSHFPNMVLPG